ncbi:MAG: hypothetical protein AAF798_19905 [Bacteroidota bacterium]
MTINYDLDDHKDYNEVFNANFGFEKSFPVDGGQYAVSANGAQNKQNKNNYKAKQ